MTSQILKHGGVTGDFQGDAAMGFWGWPISSPESPLDACRAALGIRAAFQETFGRQDHPLKNFQVGIGVAHGRAVAGKIGTAEQVKVTVFGPVVNLASRLESMTKQLRVPIVIDEATAAIVNARLDRREGRTRRLAKVLPYGIETPVVVSELLPPASAEGVLTDEQVAFFDQAVGHFIDGRWEDAYHDLHRMPASDRRRTFWAWSSPSTIACRRPVGTACSNCQINSPSSPTHSSSLGRAFLQKRARPPARPKPAGTPASPQFGDTFVVSGRPRPANGTPVALPQPNTCAPSQKLRSDSPNLEISRRKSGGKSSENRLEIVPGNPRLNMKDRVRCRSEQILGAQVPVSTLKKKADYGSRVSDRHGWGHLSRIRIDLGRPGLRQSAEAHGRAIFISHKQQPAHAPRRGDQAPSHGDRGR